MNLLNFPINKKLKILSLGAESVGRFAFYDNGKIFISPDFGDILDEKNFLRYKKTVLRYLKDHKPNVVLTDLHPLYNSTALGEELSKKLKIPHIKVQHHLAHIFSAIGDRLILNTQYSIPNTIFGIAMDGTGYGLDGNIWGGECFKITNDKLQMTNKAQISKSKRNNKNRLVIARIGNLEEQTMIGGDLAVREPARMLIAILAKIKMKNEKLKTRAARDYPVYSEMNIYRYVKKYYTRNEFEALYSQLNQNFNCQKTTSTGRVLDAASVLLGFSGNERNFKHEATKLLEKNSAKPYEDIKLRIMNNESGKILSTTYLFEYLINNLHQDKKRLAATAQLYIAKGLYEIVKNNIRFPISDIRTSFAAGGMANSKIIASFMKNRQVYISKTIPCGDEGIAFGQIIYHLFAKYI